MNGTTSRRRLFGRGVVTGALALGLSASPLTAHAQPLPVTASVSTAALPVAFFKKKKKKKKKTSAAEPGLSPDQADAKRQAIRDAAKSDLDAGNYGAAADTLEENAAMLGDPVTMQEAADARLEQARKDRSIEAAEASIATATVALDMLHFYDAVAAGDVESRWLVIDPSSASGLISESESHIDEAEALIEEINAEQEAKNEDVADASSGKSKTKDKAKKKKRDRKAKPGTGFLIGGSIATAVGAGGLGLGIAGLVQSSSKQKEVEKLGGDPANQPRIDELDKEGARANRLAYLGVGIAAAGLAIGIPLIIVGAKKRKEAGPSSNASVRVAPMVAGRLQGVALSGRF